jgi:UMF1 family MFS transporter
MKNNPKTMNSWAMYDWANSAFLLTVRTAIFPIYFEAVSKTHAIDQGAAADQSTYLIDYMGMKIQNSVAYSYNTSLAFLSVVLLLPWLSGIADYAGLKRRFMQIFCYIGAAACMAMYFFTKDTIGFGLNMMLIATIGLYGSLAFYNSFLPEIATDDKIDALSAKGYVLGYIGSVILLIINLLVIQKCEWFFDITGKTNEILSYTTNITPAAAMQQAIDYYRGIASRLAFLSVGVWWIGFAQITFYNLPKETSKGKITRSIWANGFREFIDVFKNLKHQAQLKTYLIGFLFASIGLQTTMNLASLFGAKELKMPAPNLILVLLIIQLVAAVGAYLMGKLSKKIGNLGVLVLCSIVWIGVGVAAYFVRTESQFYVLASVVGLVMGGMQAIFRSTFAKFIPENTHNSASYFSFFDNTEKIAVVIGAFVYGFVDQLTGSMRNSALALTVFFVVGLVFLIKAKRVDKTA